MLPGSEPHHGNIAEKLEQIAELIIRHGENPAASISAYVKSTSAQELNRDSRRNHGSPGALLGV